MITVSKQFMQVSEFHQIFTKYSHLNSFKLPYSERIPRGKAMGWCHFSGILNSFNLPVEFHYKNIIFLFSGIFLFFSIDNSAEMFCSGTNLQNLAE